MRYMDKVAPFLTPIGFRSIGSADAQQVVSELVARVRFSQGAIYEGRIVGGQKWYRPSPLTMAWSAAIECMVLEG